MSDNDTLLNDLYRFVKDELKFHHVCEVVPGLRGGLFDQPADGAAAHTPNGIPVIALNSDYQRWAPEWLTYVYLHEASHHRAGHVHKAARATAAHGDVYVRNAAAETYTRSIEVRADEMAKAYVKRFTKWREQQQIADLQAQVDEIRQMLGLRRAAK